MRYLRLEALACGMALLVLFLTACGGDAASPSPEPTVPPEASMQITSKAFEANGVIPVRHTGEGDDISPPLAWVGVPAGAAELALICDDPDAPVEMPWVHWVLYGLAGDLTALEEGESGGGTLGTNSWGDTRYGGPMPPTGHGVHHYHFKLYALDQSIGLAPGATKTDVLAAMKDHILAEAELIGTYERQ